MNEVAFLCLLLTTLSGGAVSTGADGGVVSAVCPEPRKAFNGSCYDFVGVRRSFWAAQARCEQGGGHLAFVRSQETEAFLRSQLDLERDWWLGLAPPHGNARERTGSLYWLDGSDFFYSDWGNEVPPGVCSAHLQGNSLFRWKATEDCNQELNFVCQYESGRAIACEGRDVELPCPSGHVINIDGGFYGRETPHYCRRPLSLSTTSFTLSTPEQCASVDVLDLLAEQCDGLEVCRANVVQSLLGEPCPVHGSYLSVKYHCEDALQLSVNKHGRVSESVNIRVFWKRRLFPDHRTCRLATGDGHFTRLQTTQRSESNVVHRYVRPGEYTVRVECSGGNGGGETDDVSAQTKVVIGGHGMELRDLTCHSGDLLSAEDGCTALLGRPLAVRMNRASGTPGITYTLLRPRGGVLASSEAAGGDVRPSLTVSSAALDLLGLGCHPLSLHASGNSPGLPQTRDLQMCVLESIADLSASVVSEDGSCLQSSDVSIRVALQKGSPVRLVFLLTGLNGSFSQSREMLRNTALYTIRNPFQGPFHIRLRASNRLSSVEMLVVCCGCDAVGPMSLMANRMNTLLKTSTSGFWKKEAHVRVVRSVGLRITATPDSTLTNRHNSVTLSRTEGYPEASTDSLKYEWKCDHCRCQDVWPTMSHEVTKDCLPNPFEYYEYSLFVYDNEGNTKDFGSTCITVSPPKFPSTTIGCDSGCVPVKADAGVRVTLQCGEDCPTVVWNIEDPNSEDSLVGSMSCYQSSGKRPLKDPKMGGKDYTVGKERLAEALASGRNLTVVTYGTNADGYATYTIDLGGTSTATSRKTREAPNLRKKDEDEKDKDKKEKGDKEKDDKEKGDKEKEDKDDTDKDDTDKDDTDKGDTDKGDTDKGDTDKDDTDKDDNNPNNPKDPTDPKDDNNPTDPKEDDNDSKDPTGPNSVDQTTAWSTCDYGKFSCGISPSKGTVLTGFNISCKSEMACPNCKYQFKTSTGVHLYCGDKSEAKSLFLPAELGDSEHKVTVDATVQGSDCSVSIKAEVKEPAGSPSVEDLQAVVDGAAADLEEQGLLAIETLAQLIQSVAKQLFRQSDKSQAGGRMKLWEKMLQTLKEENRALCAATKENQLMAEVLGSVIPQSEEFTLAKQIMLASMVQDMTSSILSGDKGSDVETLALAGAIVNIVSIILDSASEKEVLDVLLDTLDMVQDVLLRDKQVDSGPVSVHAGGVGLLVNRVRPGKGLTDPIFAPDPNSPRFTFPPVITELLSASAVVDVRMRYMWTNPFSWKKQGNISGMVSAMSLSEPDGSALLLGDMPDYLEIVMPRPVGSQQESSFVLDLANQSTVVLSVPATEETLLIKILPSVDPLPFNVYLGHGAFPTTSNYSLMTKMPYVGTTQEERYTWLVDPVELGGNVGEVYLVLRPVVGPGIKSIDATVDISVFTSSCQFWNKTKLEWSTRGCRLGAGSTFLQTQCFCNHTTDFASSFFVMPNTIDMSRVAELFGTFAQNPVVVCFVGSLFLGYLLVVIWARRKDLQDTVKLKVTVLEDNHPLEDYRYLLSVSTGHRRGASTSSQVTITMEGSDGDSEPHHLSDGGGKPVFERGGVDLFLLTTPFSLGHLQSIRLWHDNSGSDPGWYVNKVVVKDLQTEQRWYFLCNCWLAEDVGDCILDMVFPVATEMDLTGFSNLFYSKTFSGFSDGHLWFSVVSRPPSSPFTRVQRVSCCFSLLMCTMLTSILFYGVPQDPSEQVMDIGAIEFTWQQFMIGMQSSLMVFPVNVLIVSIFRYTRPRERKMSLKRPKAKPDALGPNSPLAQDHYTPRPQPAEACDLKLEAVVKDIRKTVCSLSKTLKSRSPASEKELESADGEDVSAVLSVVEAVVRQHLEKGADGDGTKDSQHLEIEPPIQADGVGVPPQTITNNSVQIYQAKTQHLHRRIGYMEQRLGQLDSSHFPDQNTHRLALEQIHTIKELLQDQMAKVQDGDLDKLTQKPDPLHPEAGKGKKRRSCCGGGQGGGLPWWFVFLGWLLVVATSVVAGFFTMMYGLKFGKQLSISWLISMAVSFFESLLVIQPLKVLGLAIFFALVFKKLDEEDHENVHTNHKFHKPTNSEAQLGHPVCRDSQLYRPPPLVDMEQMRRNRVKEQKAFALIKEILTYVGFMWMLLLVTYSQRDPNAFYLSKHIRGSFSKDTSSSMDYSKVFSWANGTLLNNLFGHHSGFITDGNSKLVGSARIRQVRVSQSACHVARPMDRLVGDCHAPYSWDAEAMGSYDPGWRERATGDNASDGQATAWTYQNQEQLRSNTIWGKSAFYRAGGFAADLGPDRINASRLLEYLYSNTWMDTYTRAVFVEFTVYNANVNLFCIVTLILETTAIGAFEFRSDLQNLRLYQSAGGFQFFIMTIEVFYFLFIFYYMYLQGKRMKEQRGAYFRCKWNLLELCIILLSWAALSMFIYRTLVGNRDMDYYHHHKQHFANFHETATADAALGYLIAFLVLLATIKLWHLLRLNPKLHMIAATLHRAWGDISGFLVVMTVMIVAYSVCGNLLFGWKLSSYMTLLDSVSTFISLQLGIFNYDEVLDYSPCLGSLFIGTSTVFMTYMVLNLFISVILMAFSYEREHHKPSEEEEIVDLMVLKLFSLLGIRSSGPPSGANTAPDPQLNK